MSLILSIILNICLYFYISLLFQCIQAISSLDELNKTFCPKQVKVFNFLWHFVYVAVFFIDLLPAIKCEIDMPPNKYLLKYAKLPACLCIFRVYSHFILHLIFFFCFLVKRFP